MSNTALRAVGVGLFFVVIFVTGYWLSRRGKPYNSLALNIHKLIALAAAVLVVWALVRQNRVTNLSAGQWIAGGATGLLFLGTGVAGGLVSLENEMPAFVMRVHQIAPYLTVLSTAVTGTLLLGRAA